VETESERLFQPARDVLMEFLQIHDWRGVLWGVLQNASVILLLTGAVWYWAREQRARSTVCGLVGALASSLLIRSSQPMASDYNEPCEVTIVTVVAMSLFQLLLVAYLGTEARWSNWRVDVGLGSMTGVSLAVAQGLTLQSPRWMGMILHSLGLTATSVLVLLGMRKLREQTLTSALRIALLLAVVTTLLTRAMHYQLILE
jgi:hypothetical protein